MLTDISNYFIEHFGEVVFIFAIIGYVVVTVGVVQAIWVIGSILKDEIIKLVNKISNNYKLRKINTMEWRRTWLEATKKVEKELTKKTY